MPTSGSGPKPFCIGAGRLGERGGKGKYGFVYTYRQRQCSSFVLFETGQMKYSCVHTWYKIIYCVEVDGMCK